MQFTYLILINRMQEKKFLSLKIQDKFCDKLLKFFKKINIVQFIYDNHNKTIFSILNIYNLTIYSNNNNNNKLL